MCLHLLTKHTGTSVFWNVWGGTVEGWDGYPQKSGKGGHGLGDCFRCLGTTGRNGGGSSPVSPPAKSRGGRAIGWFPGFSTALLLVRLDFYISLSL